MRFLVDNCLPIRLARRLDREGGSRVCHLRDHIPHNAKDDAVKQLAIEQGFIVLTKDTTFIPIRAWQKTYLEEHVSAVILGGKLAGDTGLVEIEEWFVNNWDRIQAVFENAPNPTVVRAYADGSLKVESE
ncbi:MAG: DUF5615 family PIN-like protein [Armatimonadota bacterium]